MTVVQVPALAPARKIHACTWKKKKLIGKVDRNAQLNPLILFDVEWRVLPEAFLE